MCPSPFYCILFGNFVKFCSQQKKNKQNRLESTSLVNHHPKHFCRYYISIENWKCQYAFDRFWIRLSNWLYLLIFLLMASELNFQIIYWRKEPSQKSKIILSNNLWKCWWFNDVSNHGSPDNENYNSRNDIFLLSQITFSECKQINGVHYK